MRAPLAGSLVAMLFVEQAAAGHCPPGQFYRVRLNLCVGVNTRLASAYVHIAPSRPPGADAGLQASRRMSSRSSCRRSMTGRLRISRTSACACSVPVEPSVASSILRLSQRARKVEPLHDRPPNRHQRQPVLPPHRARRARSHPRPRRRGRRPLPHRGLEVRVQIARIRAGLRRRAGLT